MPSWLRFIGPNESCDHFRWLIVSFLSGFMMYCLTIKRCPMLAPNEWIHQKTSSFSHVDAGYREVEKKKHTALAYRFPFLVRAVWGGFAFQEIKIRVAKLFRQDYNLYIPIMHWPELSSYMHIRVYVINNLPASDVTVKDVNKHQQTKIPKWQQSKTKRKRFI